MAPTTRSALSPTTPRKAYEQTPLAAAGGRKTPHCVICKKPRKGHTRARCPDTPLQAHDIASLDARLCGAMSSLRIDSPVECIRASQTVITPHKSKDTSYQTTTKEQERILSNVREPSPERSFMGENLSFLAGQPTESCDSDDTQDDFQPTEPLSLAQGSTIHTPPWIHSTSVGTRESFLCGLDRVASRAPVSIYTVPATDVKQWQLSAREGGFHEATVVKRSGKRDDVMLVISADESMVRDVCNSLANDRSSSSQSGGSYGLAQAAGGAVIGAVAAIAGLSI
ncbi:unnamed protein product [Peniophora sp. CBMAI 1063]|nr:unnamed protein product [Peniophora sp. CBMAI 1063]